MAKSQTDRLNDSLIVRALRGLIRIYQLQSSFWFRRCRFYPSCSEYMSQSLAVHGAWKGLGLGVMRILKCHPWHAGGVDLVTDK